MKKINYIYITLLIIIYLPATLFAAQKTITTYASDKNIQVNQPSSGGGGSDTCNGGTCTIACPSGTITCPCTGIGSCTCNCTSTPQNDQTFPPVVNNQTIPSITIDPVTQAIVMGSSINDGSGAMWYGGTSPAGTCNPCTAGVCTFGVGFRAYFEFKFATPDSSTNSNANADGFTFAIMNASNNNINKRGGPPNATFSMGELMGYAGPGNTAATSSSPAPTPPPLDGLGLEPPKMAIEFDTYPNPNTSANSCGNGRNDHNNNNHIALMFWGQNPSAGTMCTTAGRTTFPQASFDDNIHGAGDGTTSNPYNSAFSGNGSGLGGYYERAIGTYNWLEDGQYHRARIEVIRTSATQTYQVKAWVDCESCTTTPCTACPGNEYVYFQDVYNPYTNSSYLPKIDRTQQLTTALNTSLNQILFGFTEGTGASTQIIQITNFVIYFPPSTIGPTSASFTPGAYSNQTVSVTTASSTCTWTAVSNNSWITITGGANGTGIGTVTYSVGANTGAARTGTITIGGQIFTVNQTAYICPALFITTPTPANGIQNQSYSTTVSASGGGGTLTYSLTSGTLPIGLSLNTSTGVISGTPTTAGTWNNIRVTVSDNCWSGAQTAQTGNFSITITCPALSITTPTPANGIQNQSYSTTVSASGGSGTLTYSLTSGTLPTGLSLNTSTGVISGTPTAGGIWNNIRVTVKDNCSSGAQTAQTGNFSIRIQYNTYRVYAGTTMYYSSGSCQTLNNGSYYNLSYNNSVTFYRSSGCTGSTTTVTYSNAATADTNGNGDGTVQVNRSGNTWTLVDH
jgi:hypothetical protein